MSLQVGELLMWNIHRLHWSNLILYCVVYVHVIKSTFSNTYGQSKNMFLAFFSNLIKSNEKNQTTVSDTSVPCSSPFGSKQLQVILGKSLQALHTCIWAVLMMHDDIIPKSIESVSYLSAMWLHVYSSSFISKESMWKGSRPELKRYPGFVFFRP